MPENRFEPMRGSCQYPSMSKRDEQWTRWCRDFDAAYHDILRLFHNRYVWLAINDMIKLTGGECRPSRYSPGLPSPNSSGSGL